MHVVLVLVCKYKYRHAGIRSAVYSSALPSFHAVNSGYTNGTNDTETLTLGDIVDRSIFFQSLIDMVVGLYGLLPFTAVKEAVRLLFPAIHEGTSD